MQGDRFTKPAHKPEEALQIYKPKPYIFSKILGTHLRIYCFCRNSFTYYPSPGACTVCNRGLPLVVVGMKSEVFLAKARRRPWSDLLVMHSNRSKPFILYCSFLGVCTADHEMLRHCSPSLVSKASLFNPYMFKP